MSTTMAHEPSTDPRTTDPPRRGGLWRSRWAAIGAAVAVTLGGGTLHLAGATDSEPSGIVSITPARVVDTRVGLGFGDVIESQAPELLQVTGSVATPSGDQTVVPHGATGVLLNITVVLPGAPGFISVRPAGTPGPPETSSLNFEVGEVRPNAVFVALPTSGPNAGQIEVTYDAYGAFGPITHFLADVVGYTTELLGPGGAVDAYTKSEADAMFLTEVDAYTKEEADEAFRPLTAVVNAAGALQRGNGATSVVKQPVPDGLYFVVFDRNITECSYHATANQPGFASTGPQGPTAVAVRTFDDDGNSEDRSFSIAIHC